MYSWVSLKKLYEFFLQFEKNLQNLYFTESIGAQENININIKSMGDISDSVSEIDDLKAIKSEDEDSVEIDDLKANHDHIENAAPDDIDDKIISKFLGASDEVKESESRKRIWNSRRP